MSAAHRLGTPHTRIVASTCALLLLLSACAVQAPDPTPYPTAAPRPTEGDAVTTLRSYLRAWRARDYSAMYELVAAADRERYDERAFARLYRRFDRLAGVTSMRWWLGRITPTVLPPDARPPDLPPPTPGPTAGPAGTPLPIATATPQPTPSATPPPPDTIVAGPVPALRALVDLHYQTEVFETVNLKRQLVLVQGANGWQVRWTPEQLFPGLVATSELSLERESPPRGKIVSADDTVWARTNRDGVRVYPQEWTAGQTIGYATAVEADEVADQALDYAEGELVGRMGLELGADALLHGRPGYRLLASGPGGSSSVLLERRVVPGADVVITLRPDLQRTADAVIAGYARGAGTAVVDPKSGDVWALASAPLFNPNSMVLGTTRAGQPLTSTPAQRFNQATEAAYPTGSSFKPFTLAAALKLGIVDRGTRMPCNGTWTFSGFTFHNYLDHTLGGSVDLLEAMAFSCNTTYMPLSIDVYNEDQTALTDLIREFGFGRRTGIAYVAESAGILPDHDYFSRTPRWNGALSPYGPFDQIQLAIGQGSFLGTPLQLANAYAAIGNGGTLWVPRLVIEARLPDGRVVESSEPTVRRQISLTRSQLDYVVESIRAVVTYSYGTAHAAFSGFGIPVAGKSGTAETGGPDPDAWFPAFAPANDPEISVATVLVRVPLGTGGSDAAPLVRRVMATYFATR